MERVPILKIGQNLLVSIQIDLQDQSDIIATLCLGGMLLGTPVDDPYVEHTVLSHGGTVVLYTDGLVEDRNGALDGNLERLRLAVQDTSGDLDAFADRVLAVFGPREDDVALLAVRRR